MESAEKPTMRIKPILPLLICAASAGATLILTTVLMRTVAAQTQKGTKKVSIGYTDTPFLPGDKWRVHDANRPQPPVVTPAPASAPMPPPSNAVVLFDGKSLDNWTTMDSSPAQWHLVDGGAMEVTPKSGNHKSKIEHGSGHLHLEFATPSVVKGESQGRGNSGVFLMGIYEIQVLDNYENPTYADGTVGGIYGQTPPLCNPSRKPGEWQTYDILWDAPTFDAKGEVAKPAYVTVILNGVVVQNHTRLIGIPGHRAVTPYHAHGDKGALMLQDHGDLVRFRNIWFVPLENSNEAYH